MQLLKNKKAMSIAIVFLVLLSLTLMTTILFYLNAEKENTKEKIFLFNTMDQIHFDTNLINYYIQKIFDESTKDFKSTDSKSKFITQFLNNLTRYKNLEGNYLIKEFEQIKEQIKEENIELTSEKLILKINIDLEKSVKIKNKEALNIKYNYSKIFEKVFKP